MNDPYNLQRFVDAQNGAYEQVRSELRDGRKRGHWRWFVFPQIRGLGHSHLAEVFAISSREEAEAYLSQPILGPDYPGNRSDSGGDCCRCALVW